MQILFKKYYEKIYLLELFVFFFLGQKPTFKICQSVFNNTHFMFYKESDHIKFLKKKWACGGNSALFPLSHSTPEHCSLTLPVHFLSFFNLLILIGG